MRALSLCLLVCVVVFALTGGRVFFLPLVILPLGLFSFGHRRRRSRW